MDLILTLKALLEPTGVEVSELNITFLRFTSPHVMNSDLCGGGRVRYYTRGLLFCVHKGPLPHREVPPM